MNNLSSRINELFNKGLKAKDIAIKSDNDLEQYIISSNFYKEAATLIDELLDNTDSSYINIITRNSALKEYYLFEYNECLYVYNYKQGLFDIAINFANSARHHIELALKIINDNLALLDEETKTFSEKMKVNWTLSLHNIPIRQLEPLGKQAMLNKDFITAFDLYNQMSDLQDKVYEYVKNSQLSQIYKRIETGNYYGSKASLAMSLAGVYVVKSKNNDYQKEILEQFLEALRYAKLALNINPEQDNYKINVDKSLNNIKIFLRRNSNDWENIYYNFEDNNELLKIMKETDIKKFNEIAFKKALDLPENKEKKMLFYGIFWISVILTFFAFITFLFFLNIPFWKIILIVLLVNILYVFISSSIMRSVGDLSEKGLLANYKMALTLNFNLIKLFKKDTQKVNRE